MSVNAKYSVIAAVFETSALATQARERVFRA
jgi:hypothetical protein